MCADDLSVERSVAPDEFGFNGWGAEHKCADWSWMWEQAVAKSYVQEVV